jgi:hypothetical protein
MLSIKQKPRTIVGTAVAAAGLLGLAAGPAGASGADVAPCTTDALSASGHDLGAASGNRYVAIVLTNTGTADCTLDGYPGVQLVAADGTPVPTWVVQGLTPPAVVTLAPGTSAWSRAQFGANPDPGDSPTWPCQPIAAAAQVSPPGQTDAQVITWSYGPVCEQGRIRAEAFRAGTGPS